MFVVVRHPAGFGQCRYLTAEPNIWCPDVERAARFPTPGDALTAVCRYCSFANGVTLVCERHAGALGPAGPPVWTLKMRGGG